MPKNYSNTYLYGKYPEYDKALLSFIMEGEVINKDSDDFNGIIYEVKRRQTIPALLKVLKSEVVVLMTANKALPRQFKVFCAKDLRNGKKRDLKVYIDCTDLIYRSKSGRWACKDIDVLISYIASATHTYIYYKDEARFVNNAKVISVGAKAFAELIDYFKGVKEPVIIVMFGDHKPALEEEFYELLYDHGDEVSMEEYLERFEVPYVFWTNMDTDIDTDITSLNFLGQKLLEYAGVKTSTYTDYLLDLSDTLPAISFAGYFDSDGEAYSHLETNELTDLIDRYQIVQYSNLFGQHKEEWFDLLH